MLLGGQAKDLLARAGVPDEEGDTAYPVDNYNIAPASRIRAVRVRPGRVRRERECVRMTWGLRLHRGKGLPGEMSWVVNARSESLLAKPGFREALMSRRCLIPASGFFEWEKAGNARFPWLFQLRGAVPFFLAGIWNPAPESDGNGACVIITTEPNGLMKPIHNRMPVIVPPEEAGRWLDGDEHGGAGMLSLMPLEEKLMTARRVSTFVNNVRNNGPECVAEPGANDMPDGRQGWLF